MLISVLCLDPTSFPPSLWEGSDPGVVPRENKYSSPWEKCLTCPSPPPPRGSWLFFLIPGPPPRPPSRVFALPRRWASWPRGLTCSSGQVVCLDSAWRSLPSSDLPRLMGLGISSCTSRQRSPLVPHPPLVPPVAACSFLPHSSSYSVAHLLLPPSQHRSPWAAGVKEGTSLTSLVPSP